MADGWMSRIDGALAQRRREQTYSERRALSGGNARLIRDGNRQYLNFSSNDYLGLARHPEVIAAWQQGAAQAGVGGSGHVTGYSLHHQRLADWLGFPRALLFTSGFAANQALVAALTAFGDHILADRLSHASLLEAVMHSPATLRRFAHNDADALQRLLRRDCAGNRLVITEGVFSMDGDRAPLPALAEITRAAGGWLMPMVSASSARKDAAAPGRRPAGPAGGHLWQGGGRQRRCCARRRWPNTYYSSRVI